MKINTKGFSMIELTMIVVVLVIVGTFVYFASKSNKAEFANSDNVGSKQNVSTRSDKPLVYDNKFVTNVVRQIASNAEVQYSGNYSKTLNPANNKRENGAGIVSENGTLAEKLILDMNKVGGKVFAITSPKSSAYVLYGSLPNTNNLSFYCLGSDGSTKDSTTIVTDSASLNKKPYCK